ncbi:WhiB family transcriptional regulator [Janibacter sp. RAF20_2_2]|uniref:WhiB family transcriptional regulator n=1 Tax=unclassified Janibacter TaxID=2649294 RepID=UPI003F920CB2
MMPNERSRAATRTLATLNLHGACVRHPHPDWWFPERGRDDTDKALEVCASCPVRVMCLDYALAWDDQGVWGGTLDHERFGLGETA